MNNILIFIAGIVTIYIGANILVSNAGKFARSIGVSPLIIGLTIVGIGTSLPETAVGVISGLKKTSEISFGNILGADIFDLCLVMGISAIVSPLVLNVKLVHRELKWMVFVLLSVILFSLDGKIGLINGLLLFTLNVIYVYYCYSSATKEKKDAEILEKEVVELVSDEPVSKSKKPAIYLIQTIIGLVILIFGGEILVNTAIKFIKMWNLTGEFIGMTLVSFGTALPELTTSVIASYRNEPDISVGNIIGTVIYNTSAIVGIVSFLDVIDVSKKLLFFQLPFLLLVSFLLFYMVKTGSRISRREGFVLVLLYVVFISIVVWMR